MTDEKSPDNIKVFTTISKETHDQLKREADQRELPLATYIRLMIKRGMQVGLWVVILYISG